MSRAAWDQAEKLLCAVCSYRDLAGFILGMSSIACWLVAQLPQIISNYRNKSAEALSPWFLAEWLLVRARL